MCCLDCALMLPAAGLNCCALFTLCRGDTALVMVPRVLHLACTPMRPIWGVALHAGSHKHPSEAEPISASSLLMCLLLRLLLLLLCSLQAG